MAAICVYCASSTRAPQRYVDVAAELGAALAARGHTLVSGGGDISAMGAVARAARAGGAHTVGIIPRRLLKWEVGDQDADELLVVDDMRIRKGEMERRSDAFVALPGGLGTLEELIEVWVGATLGFHQKPVVALDPDDLYAGMRLQVDTMVERGLVRPEAAAVLQWATTVAEALDLVDAGLAGGGPHSQPVPEELLEANESED